MGHLGGDLRFVFRNFPRVDVHPEAVEAAAVAELAADLGAFWQVHDALLEHQHQLGPQFYEEVFTANGLPVDQLNTAILDEYRQRVLLHYEDGLRSNVSATPTFFINRHRYDGYHEYEALFDALRTAKNHLPR
jgi:protein-disulfide isomerase